MGTDEDGQGGGVTGCGRHLVVLGAGYVGGEVVRQGLARGMRVTALTRNGAKARALAEAGAEVIVDDLAGAAWHSHAAVRDGADYVLNCVSSGGGGLEGYRHSYVGGMKSVLAWASGVRVGAIVYTGSTSVYPQGGGVRVDETASVEETRAAGSPLVEAEDLLLAWTGGKRCVLRLAGIYGPGRHYLLDQLRDGSGEVAGHGGAEGVFNVADDGAAAKIEVTAWLAMKLGMARPRFTGEPATGRRRVTPDRVIANDKIKRVLGWRPVYPSFREGYAAILRRGA